MVSSDLNQSNSGSDEETKEVTNQNAQLEQIGDEIVINISSIPSPITDEEIKELLLAFLLAQKKQKPTERDIQFDQSVKVARIYPSTLEEDWDAKVSFNV